MPKKIVNITLDTAPAKTTKLQNAADLLATYLDEVGKAWRYLTPAQRKAVRKKYPVIDLFITTARPFFVHKFDKSKADEE